MLPKCSVLLIEDSPDSARLVSHFLSASKLAEFRVDSAASLAAAREALGRERFDAILLDLNLPDSRGIETFSRVREAARGAAIVILTAVEDEAVATRAIGQGAADYLIKGEVGGEGLARRIRFAVERSRVAATEPARAAGRVTVFVGARGGAGVTTMAINVAAALSRRERNTALVELRPHSGAMAALLHVTTPLTLDTLVELGGPSELGPASGKLPFGPRLLAAPAGLDAERRWEASAAAALIDRVAATADHVVIDATAGAADLLKAAVARASFTVVVLEREPISIQLAARMIPTLAAWAGVPNRLGAALVNHLPFVEAVSLAATRAELTCGIVGILPPAREILHSYRRQGPIVLAQPEAVVSVALDELAARLDQDPVQYMM